MDRVGVFTGSALVSSAGLTAGTTHTVPLPGLFSYLDIAFGGATSTDGTTWTQVPFFAQLGGYRAEYLDGTWFFYSQGNNAVSTDGTTFTTVTRATTAPGGTATYTIATVTAASAGNYAVRITNSLGTTTSTPVALTLIPAASACRLANMSIRTGTGDNTLIVGLGGAATSGSKAVLVRAVGPTLCAFGVGGALADPKLEIYFGSTKINENDNWAGTAELKAAFSSVAAVASANDTSRGAALVATLQPGTYTAQISGVNSTTGVALVEIYELP